MTQDGFAAQLGVGARTVQRWERGAAAPDAAAEAALLAYCQAKGLYRRYDGGALAGLDLSPDWLRDLFAAARLAVERPAAPPDAPGPRSPPDQLPAPPTELVGRAQEVAAVVERVRAARLVTLTGPGGVGKTRVAQAAAEALRADFPDGVSFVALAAIVDPRLVLPTVARALGLRESGAAPLAALTAALRERSALLVLDNLEQVLGAAPDVAALLAACPGLRVLATSRAPLRIAGEREYPIPPLPAPDPGALPPLEALAAVPAVRLFCERGRDVWPDFALTPENAAAVAAICQRVDGLPLALELAAARLKLLPPGALLTWLGHRLAVLTDGRRDAPARQRTLRGTITWSYDLLTPAQQALFRRLAVFVGGCTLEAVAAVCGDPTDDAGIGVLDGLASLVDQSLLRRGTGTDGEPRVAMLETIREYALERLEQSGEGELVRGRHGEFFLALAERADRSVAGADRRRWHDRLEAEHDNLRAALAWRAATEDAAGELRLATALFWFWSFRGHWAEGRARLEAALARAGAVGGALRARALWCAGALCWYQGDLAAARPRLQESLALAEAAADRESLAYGSGFLGLTDFYEGDHGAARARFERCVALFRAAGSRWGLADALHILGDATPDGATAWALYEESLSLYRGMGDPLAALPLTSLGRLALTRGDHAAARALLEEGLALRRADRDPWLLAISLASLGEATRCEGDHATARALFLEGLALSREVGSKSTVAWSLCSLGQVALEQGEDGPAAALLAESLLAARELGQKQRVAACLVGLASVAAARGRAARAARLLGAAEALCAAVGAALEPADQRDRDRHLAVARAALGGEAFAAAWADGRAMSLEQAIEYALAEAEQRA